MAQEYVDDVGGYSRCFTGNKKDRLAFEATVITGDRCNGILFIPLRDAVAIGDNIGILPHVLRIAHCRLSAHSEPALNKARALSNIPTQ